MGAVSQAVPENSLFFAGVWGKGGRAYGKTAKLGSWASPGSSASLLLMHENHSFFFFFFLPFHLSQGHFTFCNVSFPPSDPHCLAANAGARVLMGMCQTGSCSGRDEPLGRISRPGKSLLTHQGEEYGAWVGQ